MLTLQAVEYEFQKLYPFGTITKYTNNQYGIYFDARDTRSEAEIEMELIHGIKTDARKLYNYRVSSLKGLANKLNLDIPEIKSKINQEWEEWMKAPEDDSEPLFFD